MDRNDSNETAGTTPNTNKNGTSEDSRKSVLDASRPKGRPPGRETEDEQLLNRAVPTFPKASVPEMAAFTHSEPWRVLRVQGEFVHGINALAEVGA
ncbi:TIGR00730 family Rossman fold protein, partial [Singulisphaera rosea]